jgi:hypothetical protein
MALILEKTPSNANSMSPISGHDKIMSKITVMNGVVGVLKNILTRFNAGEILIIGNIRSRKSSKSHVIFSRCDIFELRVSLTDDLSFFTKIKKSLELKFSIKNHDSHISIFLMIHSSLKFLKMSKTIAIEDSGRESTFRLFKLGKI